MRLKSKDIKIIMLHSIMMKLYVHVVKVHYIVCKEYEEIKNSMKIQATCIKVPTDSELVYCGTLLVNLSLCYLLVILTFFSR